jgi:hypothetical protein
VEHFHLYVGVLRVVLYWQQDETLRYNPSGNLGFWDRPDLRTFPPFWYCNKLEETTFLKLDLFPSSGDWRDIPTLLGPLERANLNQWLFHFWQDDDDPKMESKL